MNLVSCALAFASFTCIAGCVEQTDQPDTETSEPALKGGPQVADPNAVTSGALVISNVLDMNPSNDVTNFDTHVTLVYGGDYANMSSVASMREVSRSAATVRLYLFQKAGLPVDRPVTNDLGQPVCDPCTFSLGGSDPAKLTLRLEDLLITANGGSWPNSLPFLEGYAVIKANVPIESLSAHAVVKQGANPFSLETMHLPVDRVY